MYKGIYHESAFVCGGDKNDMNTQLLLDIHPSFRQLVTQPTYRLSILDVLVTDMGQYYHVPVIRPPVPPDNPAVAAPSDHSIVFAMTISTGPVCRTTSSRTVRPLPETAIRKFATWVQHEPWTFVYDGSDPSDMVDRFNFLVQINLDAHCPTKTIKYTNLEGKVTTPALRQACRRKSREYTKHGNSDRYKQLKRDVKNKIREAATKFIDKQAVQVCGRNNSWMRHVKRLTARPGDLPSSSFSLPQHVEDCLTAIESSNKICEYFSSISQEYTPLDIGLLPEYVRVKLYNDPCDHPHSLIILCMKG